MDQWTPEEVDAHIEFMRDFGGRACRSAGEFVDGQALSPDGAFVRYDGEGRPPVIDGPFAETKDLIAGWMIIDVESWDRALEAGRASCRRLPGPAASRSTSGSRCGRSWPRARHGHASERATLLRELVPAVIGVLVRRGADFASAEDAVQEALVERRARLAGRPAARPKGWLVTVAWRKFLDAARREASRRRREDGRRRRAARPVRSTGADDTLRLYFLCAHPSLTPASAVALTLRAVGGLTTRADRRGLPRARGDDGAADQPRQADRLPGCRSTSRATSRTVLRVLYLVFNEGYGGDVDLAAEAIRLTRQLAAGSPTSPRSPGCWRSCCCTTPGAPSRTGAGRPARAAGRAGPRRGGTRG